MKKTTNTGLGFNSVLFIVFLVLKLIGLIDWSWWWVTAPLWLPATLIVGLLMLVFLAGILVGEK